MRTAFLFIIVLCLVSIYIHTGVPTKKEDFKPRDLKIEFDFFYLEASESKQWLWQGIVNVKINKLRPIFTDEFS